MNIHIDKEVKTPKQYSKVWMTRHQVLAWTWISIYLGVDIVYNKGGNVNNIVVLLVSSIIASLIPYFAKSYLETKEEKIMQLEQMRLKNSINSIESIYKGVDDFSDSIGEEGVG